MSELIRTKPKTVCRKCANDTPSEVYCGVEGLPERDRWSVLTGEHLRISVKCEDLNDGDCPHFKLKAT